MKNKDYEIKCLDDIRTCACGKDTKKLINFIRKSQIEENWYEAPDFLLKNENQYIGMEHFTVDLFYDDVDGVPRSGSRLSCDELYEIYDAHHKELLADQLDAEKATKEIQNSIQKDIDRIRRFSYETFLENYERIVNKHLKKVQSYRSNLHEKGILCSSFIFLIEIRQTVAHRNSCAFSFHALRDDDGTVLIKSGYLPVITYDMLNVLENLIGLIEGVVISFYAMNDITNKLQSVCYIDLSSKKSMFESLQKQKIPIFKRFSFEVPPVKIKLILDKN